MTKAQITKIINQLDNLESNMQFIKFILNDQTHGLNKRMFTIEKFINDCKGALWKDSVRVAKWQTI